MHQLRAAAGPSPPPPPPATCCRPAGTAPAASVDRSKHLAAARSRQESGARVGPATRAHERTSSRCFVANDNRVPPPEPAIAAEPSSEPGAAGFGARAASRTLTARWPLSRYRGINTQHPGALIGGRNVCMRDMRVVGLQTDEHAAHLGSVCVLIDQITSDGDARSSAVGAARGWRAGPPCSPARQLTEFAHITGPLQHACTVAAAAAGCSGAAAATTACSERQRRAEACGRCGL